MKGVDHVVETVKAINEAVNVLSDVRDFVQATPSMKRTGHNPLIVRDFDEAALLQHALNDLLSGMVRQVQGVNRLYLRLHELVYPEEAMS